MREFFLLPILAIVGLALLPVVALFGAVIFPVLALAEHMGWMKVGGIHRDNDDIGIW